MKGRPPKAPERRQGHRDSRGVPAIVRTEIPAPPDGLLRLTVSRWHTYWQSDVAKAARDAHLPMITRLFQRYDERDRAYNAVRKHGRLVTGSQGQPVANPLLKYIDSCDAEIRQLEDRLGLSPRTMAQLGASFATAQKSLDDLNQGVEATDTDDDSDADPRLSVIG